MAVKAADQVSIVDVTDAYSVILTSEAYTFVGTTTAAKPGSCTTQVVVMQGSDEVGFTIGDITCPTGVSAAVGTDGKTVTITAGSSMTEPGDVSIPVTIAGTDVVITKRFSCGLALTGAKGETGKGISKTEVAYQVGTSGTSEPTGTWSSSVVATTAPGQYLWTRTLTTYTDGSTTTSYSVGGKAGQKGDTGAKGEDAVTMAITTDNGTVFKNSSGTTTLTAHVYKAGVEVTGSALSALGTIKWYKDGDTTSVGTGATLSVSASSVDSKAVYTCQLEV